MMARNNESQYAPHWLPSQQLGSRASSVSSTSSSTSYSTPYSNSSSASASNGCISRTLSPASSVQEIGPGTVMFSKSNYQGLAQDHLHLSAAHLTQTMSTPAQCLQTGFATSHPAYPPTPAPRQMSRTPSYGYSQNPPPPQPSHLSFQAYGSSLFPSYSTTAYHSSATLPSYQIPPLAHQPPTIHHTKLRQVGAHREGSIDSNALFKGLQKLPLEVIAEIRKLVGWKSCWRVYQASRWFRDNFHPDLLPDDMRFQGVLQAETNYGRDDEDDDDPRPDSDSAPKKAKKQTPEWFACYHCYRLKKFHNFQRFQWTKSPGEVEEESRIVLSASQRPDQARSPPPRSSPPTSNPHYDPSLTASSLRAAAANKRRAGAGTAAAAAASSAVDNNNNNNNNNVNSSSPTDDATQGRDIIKATWGTRRFCVDCGLKHRIYRPRDLIMVHSPPKKDYALWVCGCWKLNHRPAVVHCAACGEHTPLRTCMAVD
ncbi:hypothetical protein VTK26DRAFT_6116 [Humicola hyalothermophila]